MLPRRLVCAVAVFVAFSAQGQAQTFEIVHRSPGSGSFVVTPSGRLLAMPDGTIYGTTPVGGEFGKGSIFRMTPDGLGGLTWSEVHSFSGIDGEKPQGGLKLGADGFIYGSTLSGGASGAGTIFRLDAAGRLTRLHDFADSGGRTPSVVLPGPGGGLYGTTAAGGAHDQGTVFRLDASGALATLHDFGEPGDGTAPTAGVILASDGFLWGTTPSGGDNGLGTVFRLNDSGAYATMHSFGGVGSGGFVPTGTLVEWAGQLYGTTSTGSVFHVFGTIFRLDSGHPTTLHVFDTSTGGMPIDGLAIGSDGSLYGNTRGYADPEPPGGLTPPEDPRLIYYPVLYRIDGSDTFGIAHQFAPGQHLPYSGLVSSSDGNLYGLGSGPPDFLGSILRFQTSGAVQPLYDVPPERAAERLGVNSPPCQTADGSLYGAFFGLAILKFDASGTETVFSRSVRHQQPGGQRPDPGERSELLCCPRGLPGQARPHRPRREPDHGLHLRPLRHGSCSQRHHRSARR